MLARTFTAGMLSWLDPDMVLHNPQLVPWFNHTGADTGLRTVTCCTDGSGPAVATAVFTRAMLRSQYVNLTYGGSVSLVYEQPVVNLFSMHLLLVLACRPFPCALGAAGAVWAPARGRSTQELRWHRSSVFCFFFFSRFCK